MQIHIDIDHPLPLFNQLIQQIKEGVSKRTLKPGDPLPSIRQLANDLELNSKTVAKAYRLLERDGVIHSRGYRGTFVHADAYKNCQIDLHQLINDELDKTLSRLRTAGATDSEIRIAFAQAINK